MQAQKELTRKKKKKSFLHELNKRKAGYLFILPQFLLFVGLMIYPVLSGIRMSFYKITLKSQTYIGFQNYQKLFADANFMKALSNTLLFVLTIVTLSVVIGIIISAAIFDKRLGYVSFIRSCYYIPVAVSMTVMAVTWSFLFSTANGLINYLIGLTGHAPINWLGDAKLVMPIIIFVTFVSNVGQVIVLYVAAMIGIPNDLFEAAEVDGASRFRQFRDIILPLVKPTTLYVIITQTISVIKIYVVIQLLTNGGPNHASVTLMYYLYEKAFLMNNQMGQAAAIGVIMFIMCLILSALQYAMTCDRKPRSGKGGVQ